MRTNHWLILIGIISLFGNLHAQEFNPSEWIGNYNGVMNLSSGKNNQTINVAFEFNEVKKDSSWTYIMKYKRPGQDELVKDYKINRLKSNTFVLDEQDGILIDLPYRNGAFLSLFEVDGMIHSSSMSLTENGIRLELFGSMIDKPSRVAENSQDEQKFVVNSFAPSYAQTVILRKVK